MSPLDLVRHRLDDATYVAECKHTLDTDGALVLPHFVATETIDAIVASAEHREADAFYANSTHNVYLTPRNAELAHDHPFNRQVVSTKGLLADDELPANSPLRGLYNDPRFRSFLCGVLGIEAIYPYADQLSSINVHFAPAGKELGWHFDNSSFAVTMLLQAPTGGAEFEYVPAVRNADAGDMAFDRVAAVLDGKKPTRVLEFNPGDLVLFRGRNAMHRVTPTVGDVTRMLVVFAYNEQPGVELSESAMQTFYGRTT